MEAVPEALVVLEQEVRRVLVLADFLGAVHTLGVVERHLGLLLRAPFDVHVHAAAQVERQLGENLEGDVHVTEHAVAVELVELLVERTEGVVALEAVVDQTRGNVVLVLGVTGIEVGHRVAALHVLVSVGRNGVDVVAPDKAVHGRCLAVARHRHVVTVLAYVVDLGRELDALADFLVQRQGERLLVVPRVGHNPVVARVGEREAGAGALARRAVDGDAVGPRHTGLEEARIPVVGIDPRQAGELARLPVLRQIEVTHLVGVEVLTVGVARNLLANGDAVVGHRGGKTPGRSLAVGQRRGDGRRTVLGLEVGPEAGLLERYRTVVGHADTLLLAAALGGDEDDAVLGHRTVKGGCGRALQHRDALDVVGVDVRHAVTEVHRGIRVGVVGARARSDRVAHHRNTVDDVERLVGAVVERRVAAQRDTHRAAGARTGRRHGQTGHLAVEVAHPVRGGRLREDVAVDLRDGVTHRFLGAGQTEGRHDHFVNLLRSLLERYVEACAGADRNLLRVVAQGLENQGGIVARHLDGVAAVDTRDDAVGRVLDQNRGSDHRRFAVRVVDDTRNASALRPCAARNQYEHEGRE